MRAGPAPSAVFKVETGVKSQGQADAPQNPTPAPPQLHPSSAAGISPRPPAAPQRRQLSTQPVAPRPSPAEP